MIQNNGQLESPRQRVTSHYRFTDISNDEITAYVSHKLAFAGGSDILVDPDAFQVLCESSQGISRAIDHIMLGALTWECSLDLVSYPLPFYEAIINGNGNS